jgi:glucosyl-3-phosphoglycerate synthase
VGKRGDKLSTGTASNGSKADRSGEYEESSQWHSGYSRILIPILNPNLAEDLVELAQALVGAGLESRASNYRAHIVVLGVVQVPEETSLSEVASLVRAYRTMLRYIPPENDANVEVRTEVRVAREIWQGIVDQVHEDHSDLLLLHWKGFTNTPGKVYGTTLDELMRNPPCDIALARFSTLPSTPKNILLPVRGGSYSNLALHFAANLVQTWHAGLTALHIPEQSGVAADAGLEDTNSAESSLSPSILHELPMGTRLLTVYGSPLRRIAGEAVSHDLVIVGAGASEAGTESMDMRLARETNRPLLVVKTRRPLEVYSPLPSVESVESNLTEHVDRWFAENTFHYREFRTMSSLTLLKERNNLSISLVFPIHSRTLPVTLAETVRRARFALIHDCALVDEIIVSVSSTPLDPTEIKFFQAGIDGNPDPRISSNSDELVFVNTALPQLNTGSEMRPPLGSGPAYALRAALEKARGDIIVWADPTMPGFEARLVYGLVGPLLSNPTLQMATGFYTEHKKGSANNADFDYLADLALRPLIGTFFPELSGILDPLCSVGAARRDLLEQLPLFTGQGFTLALLLDTLGRDGLMAITQVDLGSQPDSSIPIGPQQVVNQVLAVLMQRLEENSKSKFMHLLHPIYKTVRKVGSTYSLQLDRETETPRELTPLLRDPNYVRQNF